MVLVEKSNKCRKKFQGIGERNIVFHPLVKVIVVIKGDATFIENDIVMETCGVNNESGVFINNHIMVEFGEPDSGQVYKGCGCCCTSKGKDSEIICGRDGCKVPRNNAFVN